MTRKLHVDVRLATQVLLLQVAVVTLTLGIAGGLLAVMSHQRLAAQYETQSLDTARAIAFAPAVRADVARYDAAPLTPSPALTNELANGPLQTLATIRASGSPIPTGTSSVNMSPRIPERHWRATKR